MANLYISPTGSGDKSGSSWANAAAFSSINAIAKKAGDGGTVFLAADKGVYQQASSVSITQAGVTIKGVNANGSAGTAVFEGSRPHDWTDGAASGNELFRIARGTDNVTFKNIEVNNTGTAFRVLGDVKNLKIDSVDANNVQYYLNDLAQSGTASIKGLTITNADVKGYSRTAIAIDYDSSDILIRNVNLDSKGQIGDFPMGIHLDGTTHDVLIERVTAANSTMIDKPTKYWNGDGFSSEGGTYNVTFKNTVASGNTDGGYDLKSDHLTLINTVAEGNGRNYRFWGQDVTVINAVGLDPHKQGGNGTQSQVWVASGAEVKIIDSTFKDSGSGTKAFYNEGGSINVVNTTLQVASDAIAFFEKGFAGQSALQLTKVAATGRFSVDTIVGKLGLGEGAMLSVKPEPATNVIVTGVASETLRGTAKADVFKFDNAAATGADRITGFGQEDVLATSKALKLDSDGYVRLSDKMLFGLGQGTLQIDGLTKTGMRYLGQTADGHLYGDAAARPGGAKEGLLGVNDTLNAGDAKDKVVNSFFFDTAIKQQLGDDRVVNFGGRDVLVTSALLGSDVRGSQVAAVNGAFDLSHDGLDLGSVTVTDTKGRSVTALEYAGTMTSGSKHWYVYDAVGSHAGDTMVTPGQAGATMVPQASISNTATGRQVAASGMSETLTGTAGVDVFRFDNTATTGADCIIGFGQDDLMVTKAALKVDGDGFVRLSDRMIFGLGDSGSVQIEGMAKTGLRYLGQTADGHVYGDAAARPGGAKEGLIGVNDTLSDGDAKDKVANSFFLDTAINQHLGDDRVVNFGGRDVLITSSALGSDVRGSQVAAVNGVFDLSHDGLDLGSVAITDTAGRAVTALEYAGTMTSGTMHWYVYDAVGSFAGDALVG